MELIRLRQIHPLGWIFLSALFHLALLLAFVAGDKFSSPPATLSVEVVMEADLPGTHEHSPAEKPRLKRPVIQTRGRSVRPPLDLAISPFSPSGHYSPSTGLSEREAEGSSQLAYEPEMNKRFSKYSRLHKRIENALFFPAWIQNKHEVGSVFASLQFNRPTKGYFEITIQSESSLLRVHIAKLFRQLIEEDFKSALIGLDQNPVYIHFSFSGSERPKVELPRTVHNNRLFFERGPRAKEKLLELKNSEFQSANGAPSKKVELNLSGLFSGGSEPGEELLEEEYRIDPAYRQRETVLTGQLQT